MSFDNLRIGQGIDVHPFVEGRPLYIGGINIPHRLGLAGHSDADVLLHALMDAILGALAWGDIGTWFPNTDVKYKDVDSKELVREVWANVSKDGWKLVNCDLVVLAEEPKLLHYVPQIRQCISDLLESEVSRVG